MFDRRAYRVGFAPLIAALVVLAFSIEGTPVAIEPAPGTIEFDADGAADLTRDLVRAAPTRTPGSADDATAANIVRERFALISRGTVAEQAFGDDDELRNVVLTLPSPSDRTIVIAAGRDSRGGTGVPASASATATLVSLAASLGVSDRDLTLVFGSIDGLSESADGISKLLGGLPERLRVETVIVISQPGYATPFGPHLLATSSNDRSPSAGLVASADAILRDRAQADAGLDGPLGQIARLAIPAGSGAEAALNGDGIDAVAISSAGAVPLAPDLTTDDDFSAETLARFGAGVLAIVAALDAAPAPAVHGPDTYIRVGDNLVPGWTLGMLALALLVAPALVAASELARARRRKQGAGTALGWAGEWVLVGATPLFALFALALIGLIPRPHTPFDPGRFSIGPLEVIAIMLLLGSAVTAWWALGLRRVPAGTGPLTVGAAATVVIILGCLLIWMANPILALLLVPVAHVVVIHAIPGGPRFAGFPVAGLALLPFAAALVHVASTLDWGGSAPWHLVLMVSGGTLGAVAALGVAGVLSGLAALLYSAASAPGSRADPGAADQGSTPVAP